MSAHFAGAIQSEPHQLARCRLTRGSAAGDGTRRRGGTSPEPASAATAAQCSSAISGCMFPPIGPRSTVTTQSPQASPATMHEPQSITMFGTLGRGSDSRSRRGAQGPPSPAASWAGPPNSGLGTISTRSVAEHQRHCTCSTDSSSTDDSSITGSPEIARCQNSLALVDRTTSKRVRLPQCAQRNREVSSGRVMATKHRIPTCAVPLAHVAPHPDVSGVP